MRRVVAGAAVVVLGLLGAAGRGAAQAPPRTIDLQPTPNCPRADIDRLQKVIAFVQTKSWATHPDATPFLLVPDTADCRVTIKAQKLSDGERAALLSGGDGLLLIGKTKDYAKPSRLPVLIFAVVGGAGLVFVYRRFGRR